MIHEFNNPIRVVVEDNKKGYAIYVRDGGTFENDIWCVVHREGGPIHATAAQRSEAFLRTLGLWQGVAQ